MTTTRHQKFDLRKHVPVHAKTAREGRNTWCGPIVSRNGNVVSGGAARNIRIAAAGGMEAIIAGGARVNAVVTNTGRAPWRYARGQKLVCNGNAKWPFHI